MHASIYCNKIHIISVIINEGVIIARCAKRQQQQRRRRPTPRKTNNRFPLKASENWKVISFISHDKQK